MIPPSFAGSSAQLILASILSSCNDDKTLEGIIGRALALDPNSDPGRAMAWQAAHALAVRAEDHAAAALATSLAEPWPRNPHALLAIAASAMRSSDRALSATLAYAVLDIVPDGDDSSLASLLLRAYRCLADALDGSAALARADQDQIARRTSAAHAFARGRLLEQQRRYAAALEALTECRRLAPDNRDFILAHGEATLRTGSSEAALQATLDAQQKWPSDPEILYLASRAMRRAGDIAGAIEAALAAMPLEPAPPGLTAHLVGLLARAGQADQALDVLEAALDRDRSPTDLGPAAAVLGSASNRDRARLVAGRILRWRPFVRDAPWLAKFAGRRAELSSEAVRRTRLVSGASPPAHVFRVFAGKGHRMHRGVAPATPSSHIDLIEIQDTVLHVFPYGFLVSDRNGIAHNFSGPALHGDLVEYAMQLPERGEFNELFFATDGKFAANNYCHWLLDYMPRILWASRLKPGVAIGITAMEVSGFRAASLDHIKFDRSAIIGLANGRYRVGKLSALSNSDPRFFRNALHGGNETYARPLLDAFHLPATPGSRRIFLTRPPGTGRTFSNYDEVMAVVREAGFEIIDPGRHPFDAQVRIMGEAMAVAGPHGAGLTNLLFCPPGTRVLEIFPRDNGTLPFAMVSAVRGHRYQVMVGEPPKMTAIPGIDHNRADFAIDPSALASALARLVSPEEETILP